MVCIVTTPHIVNTAYINSNGQTLFVTEREELVKYTKCTFAETYDQWKNLKSQDLNQSSQYANTRAQFTPIFLKLLFGIASCLIETPPVDKILLAKN